MGFGCNDDGSFAIVYIFSADEHMTFVGEYGMGVPAGISVGELVEMLVEVLENTYAVG